MTKLLALGSKEENGPDLLLSAAADGSIAVWEPSAAAPQGPDKERLPKVSLARLKIARTAGRDTQSYTRRLSKRPCCFNTAPVLPSTMLLTDEISPLNRAALSFGCPQMPRQAASCPCSRDEGR